MSVPKSGENSKGSGFKPIRLCIHNTGGTYLIRVIPTANCSCIGREASVLWLYHLCASFISSQRTWLQETLICASCLGQWERLVPSGSRAPLLFPFLHLCLFPQQLVFFVFVGFVLIVLESCYVTWHDFKLESLLLSLPSVELWMCTTITGSFLEKFKFLVSSVLRI